MTTDKIAAPSKPKTPQSSDRLLKPFKCPGSAKSISTSTKPARKRRKVNYAGADGEQSNGDDAWANAERGILVNRDINRYPIFTVKDKDLTFKRRFAVPLINRDSAGYNASRVAPALGMRKGATFIAKPLHDPSGEFAIVLYDPTIDDKPLEEEVTNKEELEDSKPKLDVPLVHKTLADILGLKKQVVDHPKVPVVIDPRLAKVLRPHQVEGVKVCTLRGLKLPDAEPRLVSLPLHDWIA